jgi:G:T-mismatch repair DNA endonuclease (very short patch repair protein)
MKESELIKMNWNVIVIWECETKNIDSLALFIKERLK